MFNPNNIHLGARNSTRLGVKTGLGGASGPDLSRGHEGAFNFSFSRGVGVDVGNDINSGVGLGLGCGASTAFSFSTRDVGLHCRKGRSRVVGLIRKNGISLPAGSSLVEKTSSLFNLHASLRFKGLGLRAIISRGGSTSGDISSGKNSRARRCRFSMARCRRGHRFFLTRFFHGHCSRGVDGLPAVVSKIAVGHVRL